MINKLTVLFFTVFALSFTSCVSKRKFTDMQEGRLNAEQQVRQLTKENNDKAERIQVMITDFEAMKNELLGSNAEKDEYIDNLNKEISELESQLEQQVESLQASSFTYGFEKERLAETLQERDKTIRALESTLKELESSISQQSSVLSDRNVRMGILNDQVEALEGEKLRGERQQDVFRQQIEKLKQDIDSLNSELKVKDENIIRLQNNVNLLKRELGGN